MCTYIIKVVSNANRLGGKGETLFKPVLYLFLRVSVMTGSKMSVNDTSKIIVLVMKKPVYKSWIVICKMLP